MSKTPLIEYADQVVSAKRYDTSLYEADIGHRIAKEYSEQQITLEMLKDERIYRFWNQNPIVRRAYEYSRKNLSSQADDDNAD